MNIGLLHVLLVHFPIALGLVTVLADLLWVISRRPTFRNAGYFCLLAAAVMAVPTVVTGLARLETISAGGTLSAELHELTERHEHLALATAGVLIAAAVLRAVARDNLRKVALWVYVMLMLAVVALIPLTAHWGGMISFGTGYLSGLFGG